VNPGIDDSKAIVEYWKQGKFSFDTIATPESDAVIAKFGVDTFPTNYLIGKDGKILWRGVGFDSNAILAELKKLGIEKK
jgi:hypothetical protein